MDGSLVLARKVFRNKRLFSAEPQLYKFVLYRHEPGWLVESGEPGRRQFAFQTSAPPSTARSLRCNAGPWPEFATRVITSETTSDSRVDSDLLLRFISRELTQPRMLEANPFMPGRKSMWRAWTALERKYNGDIQFTEEMIFDSRGQLCVAKASKRSSAGGAAFKIRYVIPPLEDEELDKTPLQRVELARRRLI